MSTFDAVLLLIIGAGIFLIGILKFSESLGKNASKSTRALFNKISDSRIKGFGLGVVATAIIQSSTATNVMVVGLVNAGILNLFQAASIMLGAHVGTTSTLFLVALSEFPIRSIFMALGFVGALIKIIGKQGKIIALADLFMAFGVMFVGLHLMSNALRDDPVIRSFFTDLFIRFDSPLLLVLLGMVFTIVIQSSTASTAVFFTLMMGELLEFRGAMFLFLGAHIGTTGTALLASITTNTNGRRAAFMNLIYSLIGVVAFLSVAWPFSHLVIPHYVAAVPLMWQLPVFQLSYNVVMAFIKMWFITPVIKLTCWLIKDKEIQAEDADTEKEGKKVFRPTYIDDSLLATPSIAIDLTKMEISDMIDRTHANLERAFNALIYHDFTYKKKIKKEENRIDFLNTAISKYILKLSGSSIGKNDDLLLAGYSRVINDVERVGDYARKMLKDASRMKKSSYKFSKKDTDHLKTMYVKVMELFGLAIEIFNASDAEKLKKVYSLDTEIDSLKSKLAFGHVMWLKAGQFIQSGGEYFYASVSDLERVADHLTNIAVSMCYSPAEQPEEMQDDDDDDDEAKER